MRPNFLGIFAISLIFMSSICGLAQQNGQPSAPSERAKQIVDSFREDCDEGDRHWREGNFVTAESAWKKCFEGLGFSAKSAQEEPHTRRFVEEYLNARKRQAEQIKAETAENEAAFQDQTKDCAKGDASWEQKLYSVAEMYWNLCFGALERQIETLGPDDTRTPRIRSFLDDQRRKVAGLKDAQVREESERKAREEQEKTEKNETRLQKRIELEGLDRKEIAATPPKQLKSGAVPVVLEYLNEYLNNPKSLDIVRWSEPRLVQGDKLITVEAGSFLPWYWVVTLRYRATNAFGALMLTQEDFYIRKNRVFKVEK